MASVAPKARVWGREGYRKGISDALPPTTPTITQEQVYAEEPKYPQQAEPESEPSLTTIAVSSLCCSQAVRFVQIPRTS